MTEMKAISGAQRVDFPPPVAIPLPSEVVNYLKLCQSDKESAEAEMKKAQSDFQAAQIKYTTAATLINSSVDFMLTTHNLRNHAYSLMPTEIVVQLPPKPRVALSSEAPNLDLFGKSDATAILETADTIISKKNCKHCGNEFDAFRRQAYCTPECRAKFNKEQRKNS